MEKYCCFTIEIMKLLLIASLAIFASAYADDDSSAEVTFSLYTRFNLLSPQSLVLNDASSVANSNFVRTRPTRIITHGWRGTDNSISVGPVRRAYLATGNDNVIVINWNDKQETLSNPYATTREVGAIIAEFITFLQREAGLDVTSTTLVGHSLGAHVLAVAARSVSGTVKNLVALDPAGGTFWETIFVGVNLGVQSGDAAHVQVIHTNGGEMGLLRPTGDSDFYPNGGVRQPGCFIDTAGVCSHFRAAAYFAESLSNSVGFPSSEDATVFLGGRTLTTHARGSYTLDTNSDSPYAQG